mgnify:FL=1
MNCPCCLKRIHGRRSGAWPVGVQRRTFCGQRCRRAERRAAARFPRRWILGR